MIGTGSRGQLASDGRFLLALMLAVAVGAIFGYVVYRHVSKPFVRDRLKEPVVVDLLDRAKHNGLRLESPPDTNAVDYVQTKIFTIAGDTRDVLYMHPTSSASFHGWLPDDLRLEFAVGMDPGVWDKPGDGVQFQLEVRDGDEVTILFDTFLDPKRDLSARRWVDSSVDLSRFAYREIDLILRTLPGASSEFDWAGWAGLRMVYVEP